MSKCEIMSPPKDCPLCPRLVAFRRDNEEKFPAYWNAPVPSFGSLDAPFLVVGLAPGLKGANRTGRPFTGDYAGLILYGALKKAGLAEGEYDPEKVASRQLQVASGDVQSHSPSTINHQPYGDSFRLLNTRITNAVRCVPQENKPETDEIKTCNSFLKNEIAAMPNLNVMLSLGLVSHNAVLRALGLKLSQYKFAHGAEHALSGGRMLVNSYHTSRYNINTGNLTQEMFDAVIGKISVRLNTDRR